MSSTAWKLLDWDSAHFGLTVARLEGRLGRSEGREFLAWCRIQKVRCATYLVDAADLESLHVAQAIGFAVADLRVELEWRAERHPPPSPGAVAVRPGTQTDVNEAAGLVAEIASWSRFCRDHRFPEGKAAAMYECWVRQALEGSDQELFVVADQEGGIDGLLTARAGPEGEGRIVLVGVRAAARGRGVGAALVASAGHWFGERGVDRVRVATQGANRSALRLYEEAGFRNSSTSVWLHLWLGDE